MHELECRGKNNKCQFCSRYFAKMQGKLDHEKLVHICDFPLCKETFENAKVKKCHLLENHEKNKCNFCSLSFTTANGRASHEKYVHICDICDETFENAVVKKRHLLENHENNKGNFFIHFFTTANEMKKSHQLECHGTKAVMKENTKMSFL